MAGEMVKWMGGKLLKPSSSALQRCRAAIDAAESVLRPQEPAMMRARPAAQAVTAPARPYPGLLVDLPRKCGVHGKPYAARYVFGKDGRFSLGSMIDVTGPLYLRQYAGNQNAVAVPGADLEDETCPLCGASGFGSVLCKVCKSEVCYGRTAGRYFRCHPSCGGEGVLGPVPRVHSGVTPVDMRVR
jgi:hypothetical protein